MKKAESQLLIQDAQKPSAHRVINLKYVLAPWLTDSVRLSSSPAATCLWAARLTFRA